MDDTPGRPSLSTGWLLWFLWPVCVVACWMVGRGIDTGWNATLVILLLVAVAGLGTAAVMDTLARVARRLLLGRSPGVYDCPVCRCDIRHTPHRCPHCGTRLQWGDLPARN